MIRLATACATFVTALGVCVSANQSAHFIDLDGLLDIFAANGHVSDDIAAVIREGLTNVVRHAQAT